MANRAALIRNENMGRTVTRRGRRFVEFDMGGGQQRFVTTIEPLHYGAGETSEIDTTWMPTGGGAWQWALEANDFHIYARDVLNAGDVVQWLDTRSGESVTLQPLALNWVNNANDSRQQITQPQAVTATANDCTLTWANGYGAGRHFRYTAHPKWLIKEFIIDSAANLPAPTVANPYLEVEFILKRSAGVTLYVDGAAWDNRTKVTTATAIEFRTSGGQVVWQFDKPVATDATGSTTPGIMQLRRQGATRYVTVRFDKAWIDTAQFPISLDPTLTDGYGGDVTTAKDATIFGGAPTTNYGSITTLKIVKEGSGSDIMRSLIEFDLSSVPAGSTCNSATLTLRIITVEYYAGYIDFHELLSGRDGWDEAQVTWNVYSTGNSWGTAGCSNTSTDRAAATIGQYTGTITPSAINVALSTTDVADWFGASNANYGMLIKGNTEPDWERVELASSDHATTGYRPVLVVDYTEASSGIEGTLSATLGAVTASGAGAVAVAGTASITLGDATAAGAGTVAVAGTLAVSLDDVTLVGTGAVQIVGSLSATLEAVTLAGTVLSGSVLVVHDSYHAHSADTVSLTQVHILVIHDSYHGHTSDDITSPRDRRSSSVRPGWGVRGTVPVRGVRPVIIEPVGV